MKVLIETNLMGNHHKVPPCMLDYKKIFGTENVIPCREAVTQLNPLISEVQMSHNGARD